jgi:hypothetical protein
MFYFGVGVAAGLFTGFVIGIACAVKMIDGSDGF